MTYDAEADMRRLVAKLQKRLDQFGRYDLTPALRRMERAGATDEQLDQIMRGFLDAVHAYATRLEVQMYGYGSENGS